MTVILIIFAFLLDLLIGDPYSWPHPVKLMGNFIAWFQKRFTEGASAKRKRLLGILLWVITVGGTGGITFGLLRLTARLHPFLGMACYVYLAYTTLATKSLAIEGRKVYQKLKHEPIEAARQQVGMIVGRDTDSLSEEEITKATVETIAENTSDGVVAPLLCLFIGGPTLAMMYKAVNTLDSMVGYVTPKYKEIGWFSAKMDDLWNYVPARLTWLLLQLATGLAGLNRSNAWQVGRKDCRNHKSPNSGFPESVVAGALGIQLGGTHDYHGVTIYKPTIGEALHQADHEDILKTNRLLYITAFISITCFSLVSVASPLLLR